MKEPDVKSAPDAPQADKDSSAEEVQAPLHIVSWEALAKQMPQRRPVIIGDSVNGILRAGHMMELTGGSKAGKSWAAIALGVAAATGSKWLGFTCREGRVLYLNFEIDTASCADRVNRVWPLTAPVPDASKPRQNLRIANLRGDKRLLAGTDKLCEAVAQSIAIEAAEAETDPYGFYSLIIFDPFYMVFNGDENNAGDVKQALFSFIELAENTGSAVVYVHHHPKGAAGGKESIDRGAGSGMHGRAPDAIVDISDLAVKDSIAEKVKERYSDSARALQVSFTLREFKNPAPVPIVFDYPVYHLPPKELGLDACAVKGKNASAERKQEKTDREWSERNKLIEAAINMLGGTAEAREVYEAASFEQTYASFRRWLGDNRCDWREVEEHTEDGILIKPIRLKE